jgi:hypothetical protein
LDDSLKISLLAGNLYGDRLAVDYNIRHTLDDIADVGHSAALGFGSSWNQSSGFDDRADFARENVVASLRGVSILPEPSCMA